MSQTQDWIKQKFAQENTLVEFNNVRLTREVEDLKERIKRLEEDMAYNKMESKNGI